MTNLTPSLNMLTFTIWELIRQTPVSTDSISMDFISFLIQNTRARLIRQEINKKRSIDTYIIQDLSCVEMKAVDAAECCSESVDCIFMRSKLPIPSTIELYNNQLLTRVGPIDKTAKPFQRINYNRVPYQGLNKFTKNQICYYQKDMDGYLYLTTSKDNYSSLIEVINIQGVFENPKDAAAFKTCEGKPCYSDDDSYPIKQWMVDPLKQIVLEQLGIMVKAPQDQVSDGKNDYKPTVTN